MRRAFLFIPILVLALALSTLPSPQVTEASARRVRFATPVKVSKGDDQYAEEP